MFEDGRRTSTHQIRQPQRTHRVLVAKLHREIDVLRRCHARLEHPNRLRAEQHTEPTGRESGNVPHDDRPLAHPTCELTRLLHRLIGGALTADELEELHHGNRVEEVHADDPSGIGRGRRDARDAERGRVRPK